MSRGGRSGRVDSVRIIHSWIRLARKGVRKSHNAVKTARRRAEESRETNMPLCNFLHTGAETPDSQLRSIA